MKHSPILLALLATVTLTACQREATHDGDLETAVNTAWVGFPL